MKPKKHVFATFPEFSSLTYADREKWEELIKGYPPISDYAFSSLMTWWSSLDDCRVAQLNGNLVISYWLPGDEEGSGLSLVGTSKVDQSICEIFDWQRERGDEPRLVHVPEFVLNKVRFPGLFSCRSQRKFDECVLRVSDYASIEAVPGFKRAKAKRLMVDISEDSIALRQINLSNQEDLKDLLDMYKSWDRRAVNYLADHIEDSFVKIIQNTEELDVENLCLFIRGELSSILLFEYSAHPDYVIVPYAKFDYSIPGVFELAVHRYAKWFDSRGIKFANIDFDIGVAEYRTIQLALKPAEFFRKYEVTPRTSRYVIE